MNKIKIGKKTKILRNVPVLVPKGKVSPPKTVSRTHLEPSHEHYMTHDVCIVGSIRTRRQGTVVDTSNLGGERKPRRKRR